MALVVIIFGVLAGLAVASLILSGGCRLVGVDPPDLFPGMLICLVVAVAQGVVQLMVVAVMAVGAGLTGMPSPEQAKQLGLQALVISIPLNILVTAGLYSVMLQGCSFLRGLLVWLAQLVVLIVCGAAVVALFYGLTQKKA